MQVPEFIEEMKVLYYASTEGHKGQLRKYMPLVPDMLVIVYEPSDKSICILGTDEQFNHWDRYMNYVFKELQPAMEAPFIVFRIDDFKWKKRQ